MSANALIAIQSDAAMLYPYSKGRREGAVGSSVFPSDQAERRVRLYGVNTSAQGLITEEKLIFPHTPR